MPVPEGEILSFKTQAAHLGFSAILVGLYKTTKPGVWFAIDHFLFNLANAVGIGSLGPWVNPAHAAKLTFIAGAFTESAFQHTHMVQPYGGCLVGRPARENGALARMHTLAAFLAFPTIHIGLKATVEIHSIHAGDTHGCNVKVVGIRNIPVDGDIDIQPFKTGRCCFQLPPDIGHMPWQRGQLNPGLLCHFFRRRL